MNQGKNTLVEEIAHTNQPRIEKTTFLKKKKFNDKVNYSSVQDKLKTTHDDSSVLKILMSQLKQICSRGERERERERER